MLLNSLRVPLLAAQTVDETTSPWVDCSGWSNLVIYVIGAGTIASGVITIEEADMNPATLASAPYTGTASAITTVNAADVTGGAQKAIHFSGAYGFVRTRISTAVAGGGTISTVLRAS